MQIALEGESGDFFLRSGEACDWLPSASPRRGSFNRCGVQVARLMQRAGRVASGPVRLTVAPKRAVGAMGFDYRSAEWVSLRDARRKDPDFKAGCKCCGAKGRLTLDHVVEIRDGGAQLDPANTQWLCSPCHGRKTEEAKRRRLGLG